MTLGRLYLIPTQLADPIEAALILPAKVIERAQTLDYFIAENAKSARAFLKGIGVPRPLAEINIVEMQKHAPTTAEARALLAPLVAGRDVGLVSEAGAPAVADPGALVVAAAHALGARVCPLVGPSSLLLALMASGLNGQRFKFHGYLPQEKATRVSSLQKLERDSRDGTTQMFIETPYRNAGLLADALATLAPTTRLCVAQDLTGETERISTLRVDAWRKRSCALLEKKPAIFLLLAAA